jgi:hypothetical protein
VFEDENWIKVGEEERPVAARYELKRRWLENVCSDQERDDSEVVLVWMVEVEWTHV